MNRIGELRKARGLSQQQLAEMLGIHQTAVSQWESGQTEPSFSSIVGMCQIFGAQAEYLMGYNGLSMTGNEYQALAMRTASDRDERWLENAALGLAGESGECADMVKKHLFQKQPFDKEHFAKELGDILWYIALGATCTGYSLEDIMRMNIEKLRKRYPEGFDPERSKHREAGDV